jgi:hypothetical protein
MEETFVIVGGRRYKIEEIVGKEINKTSDIEFIQIEDGRIKGRVRFVNFGIYRIIGEAMLTNSLLQKIEEFSQKTGIYLHLPKVKYR